MVKLETVHPGMPNARFYFINSVECEIFIDTFEKKGFKGEMALPWGRPQYQSDFPEMTEKERKYMETWKSGQEMAMEHLDWACAYLTEMHPGMLGHHRVTKEAVLRRINNVSA